MLENILLSIQIYISLINVYLIEIDDTAHDQSIQCAKPQNWFDFVYILKSELDEYSNFNEKWRQNVLLQTSTN